MHIAEGRTTLISPSGVVGRVIWATSFRERRRGVLERGVLGRDKLGPHEALVIKPCRQVHTRGVGYDLDVVFCDRSLRVLHVETLEPGRVSKRVSRARLCVELLGGRAAETGIEPGVQLSLEDPS